MSTQIDALLAIPAIIKAGAAFKAKNGKTMDWEDVDALNLFPNYGPFTDNKNKEVSTAKTVLYRAKTALDPENKNGDAESHALVNAVFSRINRSSATGGKVSADIKAQIRQAIGVDSLAVADISATVADM